MTPSRSGLTLLGSLSRLVDSQFAFGFLLLRMMLERVDGRLQRPSVVNLKIWVTVGGAQAQGEKQRALPFLDPPKVQICRKDAFTSAPRSSSQVAARRSPVELS